MKTNIEKIIGYAEIKAAEYNPERKEELLIKVPVDVIDALKLEEPTTEEILLISIIYNYF